MVEHTIKIGVALDDVDDKGSGMPPDKPGQIPPYLIHLECEMLGLETAYVCLISCPIL